MANFESRVYHTRRTAKTHLPCGAVPIRPWPATQTPVDVGAARRSQTVAELGWRHLHRLRISRARRARVIASCDGRLPFLRSSLRYRGCASFFSSHLRSDVWYLAYIGIDIGIGMRRLFLTDVDRLGFAPISCRRPRSVNARTRGGYPKGAQFGQRNPLSEVRAREASKKTSPQCISQN